MPIIMEPGKAENIHEGFKEILSDFDVPEDAQRPVEFFFYAPDEDAAANLSISLHSLGYKMYTIGPPNKIGSSYRVSGHTPMMSTKVAFLAEWYGQMTELATEHNCEFDGYGTLVDEPEDGSEM